MPINYLKIPKDEEFTIWLVKITLKACQAEEDSKEDSTDSQVEWVLTFKIWWEGSEALAEWAVLESQEVLEVKEDSKVEDNNKEAEEDNRHIRSVSEAECQEEWDFNFEWSFKFLLNLTILLIFKAEYLTYWNIERIES